MTPKLYRIIEGCIERGVAGGLYNEDLLGDHNFLVERFTSRVMLELDEYFVFDYPE